MAMTIEELITFCEEEEQNHRVKAKRADDASGYTRSKDKNIRTACAIREDTYADFYKEIIETMRKYQKIEQILDDCDLEAWEVLKKIKEVVDNG